MAASDVSHCNFLQSKAAGAISVPAQIAVDEVPPREIAPPLMELFLAFLKITVSGLGSILRWTRREFVSVRHWMTADEFNELFSLCQFLPGPNIVNFALIYGYRVHGVAGIAAGRLHCSCVADSPDDALYGRYGRVPAVRDGLTGLAAATAGLLVSSAVQMAEPLFRSRRYSGSFC